MVHHVVFVAGSPGAGKSTAIRMLAQSPEYRMEDSEVQWTFKSPYAIVGHYQGEGMEDSSDQGGDRVARHANLLCLEYWKMNILPDPRFTVTILDSEMFMTETIFNALASGSLNFIDFSDFDDKGVQRRKEYQVGGLRAKSWNQILKGDPDRFPLTPGLDRENLPEVRFSCVHLVASLEVAQARRKAREDSSKKVKKSVFSDQRWKSLITRQLNWASKFQSEEEQVETDDTFDAFDDLFCAPTESITPPSTERRLGYLEIDVDNKDPQEIAKLLGDYAQRWDPSYPWLE